MDARTLTKLKRIFNSARSLDLQELCSIATPSIAAFNSFGVALRMEERVSPLNLRELEELLPQCDGFHDKAGNLRVTHIAGILKRAERSVLGEVVVSSALLHGSSSERSNARLDTRKRPVKRKWLTISHPDSDPEGPPRKKTKQSRRKLGARKTSTHKELLL